MNESPLTNDGRSTAIRGLVRYAGWSLLAMLLLVAPAAATSADWSPVAAWCLTFLPGAAVVAMADRLRDPKLVVGFVLLSTAFRMVVAGIGAGLLLWAVPAVPRTVFLIWLGAMYVLALGVEIYLTMSINSLWNVTQAGLHRAELHHTVSATNLQEAGR